MSIYFAHYRTISHKTNDRRISGFEKQLYLLVVGANFDLIDEYCRIFGHPMVWPSTLGTIGQI